MSEIITESKDSKEKLFIFIGILITLGYLILGILYPIYDYDIKEWLSIQPLPAKLTFFEPELPHAILPGLLAGIFANITHVSLYTSHIIISCILTGCALTLLMIYSYRITQNFCASIILAFITSFTRCFVVISLSGENDLGGSFLLLILLFQI